MSSLAVILGPDTPASRVRLKECQAVADRIGGLEIRFVDSELPEAELVQSLKDAVAIMPAGARKFTPEMIERLPNLRLIQTFSAGTDYLDKTMLAEAGVDVSNNGGQCGGCG